RGGWVAARDRREPALRRRIPAPARCGQPLPGTRRRARRRRAARADGRRVPRGSRYDALLLRPLPHRGQRRPAGAVRRGSSRAGRQRAGGGMTTTEERSRTKPPDLEPEREVDFSRYLDALVARWWLPVAGLII